MIIFKLVRLYKFTCTNCHAQWQVSDIDEDAWVFQTCPRCADCWEPVDEAESDE